MWAKPRQDALLSAWDEGLVDLRSIIQTGAMFEPLRNPENFAQVYVANLGHSIFWGQEDDEDVDFSCDRLRELAEEQAALLAHAS